MAECTNKMAAIERERHRKGRVGGLLGRHKTMSTMLMNAKEAKGSHPRFCESGMSCSVASSHRRADLTPES